MKDPQERLWHPSKFDVMTLYHILSTFVVYKSTTYSSYSYIMTHIGTNYIYYV